MPSDILQILSLATSILILAGVIFVFLKMTPTAREIPAALAERLNALEKSLQNLERILREENAADRKEISANIATFRGEINNTLHAQNENLLARLAAQNLAQTEAIARLQNDTAAKNDTFRQVVERIFREQNETLFVCLEAQSKILREQLETLARNNTERLEKIGEILHKNISDLREENAKKLEEMRATVDEKLQSTLEKRLGESFKQVSERLENVHKSLGEMQTIAASVGDLKRVMTNVKTRGIIGEFQLGAILEDILTPEQFARNVKPNPRANAIVEFAVKLPGQENGTAVWLPIDSKFPKENYERLLDAAERADAQAAEQAISALTGAIENFARDIKNKYITPPHTTNFAILFLPTEGLYAEILRHPDFVAKIQNEIGVIITGPTTLAALLNSLRIGFQTLAIQKKSSEIWKLLGAIKTQFGNFGGILEKVEKKLAEATKEVGNAADRHRKIATKLNKVETLSETEANAILPLENDTAEETEN